MATDFTLPAPREPVKQGDYLHTREGIPTAPELTRNQLIRRHGIVVMGVIIALGLGIAALQNYAGWDDSRNVALVTMASLCGPAGVALGYLLYRGRWDFAVPGILIIVLALGFVGVNALYGYENSGESRFRDALTIMGAIVLFAVVAYTVVALAYVELKDPSRAPAPEM